MKISRLVFALLLVSSLLGCSDTHRLVRTEGVDLTASKALSAYLVVPRDGQYGTIFYTGSGAMVAQEVEMAFSPYLENIVVGGRYEHLDNALSRAREKAVDYLIYPEILHWEDRATEWSGRPDVVSIRVTIIDVSTGEKVDSAELGGTSKVMSWGGDHPQDLLAKPLADYAAGLFNR
ncbi:MAG: DUF4823 domain-containing protein [Pseudomonadota bacterium]